MFKAHIKFIVLEELNKVASSGYDLMNSIGEFGKRPSPGYIYPLLNDLEKRNFISSKVSGRRKVYCITKNGKKFLKNLKKKRIIMLNKMIEMWSPIADGKEIKKLKKFKNSDGDNVPPLKDIGLIKRLHDLILTSYRSNVNKKNKIKIRKILINAIGEIEDTIKKQSQ